MSDSSLVVAASEEDFQTLCRVVTTHGLSVTDEQAAQLAQYCRLLWDWNSRLNLTRHTNWDLFVTRDLLDTIKLAEHIPHEVRVLDVGSGGGVPGIVLAILRPDLTVSLCESVGKKSTVLQAIVTTMQLPIPVHGERAEDLLRRHRFQFVTVRAVGSISKLLNCLLPVWGAVGQLLLIKGPHWVEEHTAAQEDGSLKRRKLEQISSWSTPGRDGKSVLLRITKAG